MSTLIPLTLPLFALFAIFVCFMMRMMIHNTGGWPDLFPKYKTQKQAKEILNARNLKIRNCNFGGVGQNNLMKFYETREGLLISPLWFIKKDNYNLLIPWSEIVETRKRKLLFATSYRLIIGEPFVSSIDLSERDFKKIRKNLSS